MPNISYINCNGVDEFWEALTSSKLSSASTVYRGHGDADKWKLLASIHRPQHNPGLFRICKECNAIKDFVEFCDQARLAVPGDCQAMRKTLDNWNMIKKAEHAFSHPEEWPPNEFYDIIALMQHFEFPTCFLDWTRSPYIAAFFAASHVIMDEKLQENIEKKNLAVWALERFPDLFSSPKQFEYINVPPNNRNIYAQSGVFTLLRVYEKEELGAVPIELEKFLEEYVDEYPEPFLKKITISTNFTRDIIERCSCYSINFSTVFPDYTGVSKQMKFQKKLMEFQDLHS